MSTLLALPVLTSLALTPAQTPCEGWTTEEFWEAVDPTTVRECVSYGYSVDDRSPLRNATPLHWAAAFSDNPEVISVLIEAGASLEASSHDVRTPLHFAARSNGNPEVLRTLLQYGADVYAKNPRGRTPLHLAALYNDNPAIVAELVRVTHVNVRTRAGETPLHDATRKRGFPSIGDPNPAVVAVLLRNGADLSAADNDGATPERWAEDRRVVEMIREEGVRREAIRERFLQDVTTRVAVGSLVLGLLGYLLERLCGARRRLSDA
ncbi:ankyrin repeat domain-containing protein [Candidatus Palauibacter sp.]|uniref:ankyrin repeat domain-containing protein n=1 Tax=Candidatus Palauibacter sp. TaxID=3101350 RepID=UPI003AF293A3